MQNMVKDMRRTITPKFLIGGNIMPKGYLKKLLGQVIWDQKFAHFCLTPNSWKSLDKTVQIFDAIWLCQVSFKKWPLGIIFPL